MFRIGGNKFYDQKNEIPMKILELKTSRIGIIAEFCRILTTFHNHGVRVCPPPRQQRHHDGWWSGGREGIVEL
jgi:hypothetical protein